MCLTNKGPDAWNLLRHCCPQCWQCCTAHIFCNEKGKISSGSVVAGLWVCCGEFGRASRRARERGSAHALLPWASGDVRQHQLTVPAAKIHLDFRGGNASNHQSSWFCSLWLLGPEWRACIYPVPLIPKAWVLVQAPLDILVAVEGTATTSTNHHNEFSFEAKTEEVKSLIFFLMRLIFFTQADTHCSAFMPSWEYGEAVSCKLFLVINVVPQLQWILNSSEVFE